ncbi:MAG: DNA mismatch repair protein MutT [Gammaproteobacteria bacterium RIFCSPHIGHO2_12_FULL_63_22]|nr:MAG: DNA mismatch repair protein MutT [Gammaproteobacteria bacterium RIFCSPHIGHO2_12_FULL_63_22]
MDDPVETVYEGKWLRMKKRGRWEFAERTNAGGMAVIIVAATPDGNLLFVEQDRIPVEGKTIEMPAGLVGDIDAGESIELAASRELLEETGWQASRIDVLLIGPTSSGMSNERVAFVRARGLVRVHAGGGDDSEQILVHEVPIASAPAWLAAKMAEGYQLDAKLWAGLWLLDRNPDGSPA